MRLLLAGIDTPIAKQFIKDYKFKYGMVALDPSKADFSRYEPIKDVFTSYRFDGVIYFASGHGKELSLFKNLQYACLMFGIKKMLTVIIADPGAVYDPLITVGEHELFDSLVPALILKDKIGTALRFYEVCGKGEKDSVVAKMVMQAKKKGRIDIEQNKQIALLHVTDAAKVLDAFVSTPTEKGVYDAAAPTAVTLAKIAETVKKSIGGIEIKIQDRTLADTPEIDTAPLIEQLGKKFKFTNLTKVIEEML